LCFYPKISAKFLFFFNWYRAVQYVADLNTKSFIFQSPQMD
jgi:hypothetical protein